MRLVGALAFGLGAALAAAGMEPDLADRFVPEYTPPAPGTYRLAVVDTVGDHPLLDAAGRRTSLFALQRDRVAVVAFIYTTCAEAAGCPVSTAVLHRLDRLLAADATLARAATLLTVSFDPERDTPARMARVRDLHAPQADWRFATARDEAELRPLLDDFGQPVAKLRDEEGRWSGVFRHVLKVFLLDRAHRVRNVYSVGFLNPALVLNDVRTLLLEEEGPRARR
jgi:cytochrome c peroxidase